MRVPTVHINGTSGDELERQFRTASRALAAALDALVAASPNCRDYYVQGPDATREASNEHASRMEKVGDVLQEIDGIREAIADQATVDVRRNQE